MYTQEGLQVQRIDSIKTVVIGDDDAVDDVALFYVDRTECELQDSDECSDDGLAWGVPDDSNAPLICTRHFFDPESIGCEFVEA